MRHLMPVEALAMPPAPSPATPSGIVAKDGADDRVIPASVRADGSVRKERKVRPGFTPQEDVARFRPSRVLHAEGRAPAPRRAGVSWTEAAQAPAKASPGRPRRNQPERPVKEPKEPLQGAAKEPAKTPGKGPGKEPAKDTTPEWRSTARPRTTKPGPRSQAERDSEAVPDAAPDAVDTLDASLSALSIKDRGV
ncbi:hypothetical protein MCAP1_000432 [Malassezia caprae]|uniref:WIBG Mago-binding domain-containing protein n=1 Tax=Malassezia caprae TaxID=1381934 RepID=A0AAF0IV64_9BASI|nr:hypothetical protein MCAP1_000432 [Malassezia caprae]